MGKDNQKYDMYVPGKKKRRNKKSGSVKRFFRKYLFFRFPRQLIDPLKQFGLITLIGLVLNFFYYNQISVYYLFIGGVQEWFSVLQDQLNYGITFNYNLFYVVINGIFYWYLYLSMFYVLQTLVNILDKPNTWKMLLWAILSFFVIINIFP